MGGWGVGGRERVRTRTAGRHVSQEEKENLNSPIASKEIVNFLTYEKSGPEGFMVNSTKHLKKT